MNSLKIGAHIPKESGSIIKTFDIIKKNKGNALQLFISNPRSAELSNIQNYSKIASEIHNYCKLNNFELVIHAPYTINLAKEPKINKRTVDLKDCYWVNLMINQLTVSDLIGSIGVVVHVGKYTTNSKEDGLKFMYNSLIYIIEEMKRLKINSKLILETPAGAGTELLTDIDEFIIFYDSFSDSYKEHMGICIDTAHVWSSGYDLNEYYNYIAKTHNNDIIVIHLNNSKKEQGSNADNHDTLFEGKIPLRDIELFIKNINHNPLIILETPSNKNLDKEIEWLQSNIKK